MYTPQDEQRIYKTAKELLSQTDTPEHPEESMQTLQEVLRYADWKYYVQSESALADVEYDRLFKKLKALEEEFPEHCSPDSPTQRVARGLSERFPPVAHLVPMLSLDNTYNAEDLREWDAKVRKGAGEGAVVEYCIEPKYDGASVSLIYGKEGRMERGATRGDGVTGEEITPNIRQIRSIPLRAAFEEAGISQIEIRGEVVIHKETFAAYNAERVKAGLSLLANPRNAASGTLRMLDPAEVAKRRLSAILYHISYWQQGEKPLPTQLSTHYGSIEWLYSLGFPTPFREMKRCGTIDEVIDYCNDFESRRDDLPFEVDGLVIKVNSLELQDKLGMTSHHPRWAVAYKLAARQATSKLLRVDYQVGRTGNIGPVAKTEPVAIGGVMVSSISLFNEDIIREKDIRIGDVVLMERAGDVIPYIVKPLAELRDGTEQPIVFPTHCPACGEPLDRPEGEAAWRCINASNCPAQVVERLIHYCSKDALDIVGMGESSVQKFYEQGVVTTLPGIYRADWERVSGMDGFGAKKVANLKAGIEKSKGQPLYRLLFGLGVRHVGETTAKTVASAVSHLRDLYDFTEEQLTALPDIGPKVAASIVHFFKNEENRAMIDTLEAAGVCLENKQRSQPAGDGALTGKTFLFTGTLAMKRAEAEAMVETQGGAILNGVSSKLNYLVAGADAGSKLDKAKKLGTVRVLTEEEFLGMMQQEENAPASDDIAPATLF